MTSYKLTYFNIRGRAEPIRLLFAVANVPYEDIRISKEEWPQLKTRMTWGQLPTLEVTLSPSGPRIVSITQTMAILRYLSRQFGLYSEELLGAAKIDEYAYAIVDLTIEWQKYLKEQDEDKKSSLKESLLSLNFPKYFETLSKQYLLHGGPYLLGEKITLADILLVSLLDDIDTELEGVVDHYPVMLGVKEEVWGIPSVKEYVEQRP